MSPHVRTARGRRALQVSFIALCVSGVLSTHWLTENRMISIVRERSNLAHVIASNASVLLTRGDNETLQRTIELLPEIHPEIASVRLIPEGEQPAITSATHQDWDTGFADPEQHLEVPLFQGQQRWGTLDLRMHPIPRIVPSLRLVSIWVGAAAILFLVLYQIFRTGMALADSAALTDSLVPGKMRRLLEGLSEGVLVLDAGGQIQYANSAFCGLVNKPLELLTGKRPEILPWILPPKDDFKPPWTVVIHDECRVENATLHLRNIDGRTLVLRVTASPLYSEGGAFAGQIASFDDISLFEQYKLDLSAARDAAEQASRTKSEFLANISHEIRTPMNAILGFTDVLRRGLAESRQHAVEYLNTIHSSGTHLLGLINDVLDLSKIEAGHLQIETLETHPHEILFDVVNVLGVNAREKAITLQYSSAAPIPEGIQSDPTRLRQILMNLVGNAVKFTEKGGVTVVSSYEAEKGKAPILRVDVTDSGVGMSESVVAGLFEAFVQADSTVTRKFGGTGLGLVISRRYARAMGGDIVVTSQPGEGSTFSLRIPTGNTKGFRLTTADEALVEIRNRQQNRNTNPVSIRLRKCRILVVDDGEANRRLLCLVLKRAGATVEQAINGQEAVDIVSLRDFDVVLMDMQMPVKDGYTATRELRDHNFRKPIIALTGHAMTGDDEKCLEAGCSDFLTKPVDIDVLLGRIANIVGRAEEPAEPASLPAPAAAPQEPAASSRGTGPRTASESGILSAPFPHREIRTVQPPLSTAPTAPVAAPATAAYSPLPVPDETGREFTRPSLRLLEAARTRGGPLPAPPAPPPLRKEGPITSRLPMSDPEFRSIVEQFVGKLRDEHRLMIADLHPGGLESLARRGHWLKGAGGTVGFPEFTTPARDLERAAQEKNPQAAAQAIQAIGELLGRVEISA
ncbi:response regulator [Planctomyces sp. SH-PL14]|uniref:hybrid sensor histidine kinase/response regulator n=1 Tax=Planctomyces sp. SH-PL14 TaxID=1632864 RepID=UPI00078E30D9|nr:response regulator [Planctomyces sp. SH-PL14]AMV21351.1 Aerobic respiration control sensor protein ArcB [Planctomyces sp. SH-PL14]